MKGCEKKPMPLEFSPATLTVYSVSGSKSLKKATVVFELGCTSCSVVSPNESSRVQPVGGLVVLEENTGSYSRGVNVNASGGKEVMER